MIGDYRHLVLFQSPGTPVANGDGGFTQSWTDLVPGSWHVSIEPATARDLERVAAGTVLSTASHIVKGRYHPGVNTSTRMIFGGRTFSITGKANLEERSIHMELIAVEVVD
jgi:SPP1 family predicted phage head-tail adaptor